MMGVNTMAFSIPPNMMEKIMVDNDNLNYIFGENKNENNVWKVESFGFGTRSEEVVKILRTGGFEKTAKRIDCETYFYEKKESYLNFAGIDTWILPPAEVEDSVKEIKIASVDELITKGIAEELRDDKGNRMSVSDTNGFIGNIEDIKEFFQTTAADGNYLIFTEA